VNDDDVFIKKLYARCMLAPIPVMALPIRALFPITAPFWGPAAGK
jgi:hypothetical protein